MNTLLLCFTIMVSFLYKNDIHIIIAGIKKVKINKHIVKLYVNFAKISITIFEGKNRPVKISHK